MKFSLSFSIFLAASSLLVAAEFPTFSEDFNEGPGSAAFRNFRAHDGGPSGFPYRATGGTADSGAVMASSGIGINFWFGGGGEPEFVDLSGLPAGSKVTTSVDLKLNLSTDGLTVLTFGFTLKETQNAFTMERGQNIAGSLIRPADSPAFVLRMRSDSTDLETLEIKPGSLVEEWYRLTLILEKSAATGNLDYSLTLSSLGADGTSDPVVFHDGEKEIALKGTLDNSPVLNSGNARWAVDVRASSFDARSRVSQGIGVIDNFVLKKDP